MSTPREQLANTLKEARLAAGYDSQGKLAKRLHVSRPAVNRAESPTAPVPSDPLLAAWADATKTDLAALLDLAQRIKTGTPEWFMSYKAAEQEATSLRLWAPLVVPGLLQTPEYARSLLSDRPRPAEQLQALVDQRMERQQVIGRAQIAAALDHRVLAHAIGSPAIMSAQCAHLGRLIENQLVSLHIVPDMGNVSLTGAFAIATKGPVSTVSMTASARDITSTAADMIEENTRLFDLVMGASLPVVQSLEFVRQMEETWKERS